MIHVASHVHRELPHEKIMRLQVCQSLNTSLGVNESSSDINNTVLIHNIQRYGHQIKMKSLNTFKCLFENHVRSL